MSNAWLNDASTPGINNSTLVLIKPVGLSHWPRIKKTILETAPIARTRLVMVTDELIKTHYAEHHGKEWFEQLTNYFVGKYVLAVEILADPQKIRDIIGPTKPTGASNSNTIRGLVESLTPSDTTVTEYTKGVDNLIHGADSEDAARREIQLWFGQELPEQPQFLCLTNHNLDLEGAVSPFINVRFDISDSMTLASHVTDFMEALPWNAQWRKAGVALPKVLVGGLTPVSVIGVQYLSTLTGKKVEICWMNPETGDLQIVPLQSVVDRAARHRS
jgi:nucleoside-diphosphate kinase